MKNYCYGYIKGGCDIIARPVCRTVVFSSSHPSLFWSGAPVSAIYFNCVALPLLWRLIYMSSQNVCTQINSRCTCWECGKKKLACVRSTATGGLLNLHFISHFVHDIGIFPSENAHELDVLVHKFSLYSTLNGSSKIMWPKCFAWIDNHGDAKFWWTDENGVWIMECSRHRISWNKRAQDLRHF